MKVIAFLVIVLLAGCNAESAEAPEQPERRVILSMPLQWDATVSQVGSDGKPRTRYYVRSSK